MAGAAAAEWTDAEVRARWKTHSKSLNMGDATWHCGWTVHCAGLNSSASTREALTVCFAARGAQKYTEQQEVASELCRYAAEFDRRDETI